MKIRDNQGRTRQQRRDAVLQYIRLRSAAVQHRGLSIREIMRSVRISTVSTAALDVAALKDEGLITQGPPSGYARRSDAAYGTIRAVPSGVVHDLRDLPTVFH